VCREVGKGRCRLDEEGRCMNGKWRGVESMIEWWKLYLLPLMFGIILLSLFRRHLLVGFLFLCPSQQFVDGRETTRESYLLLFRSFLIIELLAFLGVHLLIGFFLLWPS